MVFYPNRTVAEQKSRLPSDFQANYEATQLDRIEIDGVTIQGYFEYSFLEEKSYMEQPQRAQDGSIVDIDSYATFLTPRLIIKYNMMNIEDYRALMKLLKSKNAFQVTCYDIVEDKRVTHEMYCAPPAMPIIYQQYLQAMGIKEYTIELIGTNNVSSYTITYHYNKSGPPTLPNVATVPKNSSLVLDDEFRFEYVSGGSVIADGATGWNTQPDGSGISYTAGNAYYFSQDTHLWLQWG